MAAGLGAAVGDRKVGAATLRGGTGTRTGRPGSGCVTAAASGLGLAESAQREV